MSEFTITGPGEYRTRDGRKVTVTDRDTHKIYPWTGHIDGSNGKGVEMFPSWTDGGSIATFYDFNPGDIIGPWIEAEGDSPDYGSVAVPSALAERREVDEARESARVLSAALRILLDAPAEPGSAEYRDAVLVARAVLEVHGK